MGATRSWALTTTIAATALLLAMVPPGGAGILGPDVTCPGPDERNHWDTVILGNVPQWTLGLEEKLPGCFVHASCDLGADPCVYEIVVYVNGTGVKHGVATRQDIQQTHECGPTLDECKIQFQASRPNDLQVTCGVGMLTTAVDVTLYCRNHVVGPA